MFWDSSALIPLILPESRSVALAERLRAEKTLTVWWGTPVECLSAVYRRHRDTPIPEALLGEALGRLRGLIEDADTVAPGDALRRRAGRLLAVHTLRAGDALQLAAALAWCEEHPAGEGFLCLDDRLREAARREGFDVLP